MSPLGRIDFASAPDFEAVPAGIYEGYTDSWEAKPTKAGDSTNVEGKFRFNFIDGNGNEQTRSIIARWNLKLGALWRIRTDLVNMGIRAEEFTSSTNLETLLNQVFGAVPTPVSLHIVQQPWTPESGGETQIRNNVTAVHKRS